MVPLPPLGFPGILGCPPAPISGGGSPPPHPQVWGHQVYGAPSSFVLPFPPVPYWGPPHPPLPPELSIFDTGTAPRNGGAAPLRALPFPHPRRDLSVLFKAREGAWLSQAPPLEPGPAHSRLPPAVASLRPRPFRAEGAWPALLKPRPPPLAPPPRAAFREIRAEAIAPPPSPLAPPPSAEFKETARNYFC